MKTRKELIVMMFVFAALLGMCITLMVIVALSSSEAESPEAHAERLSVFCEITAYCPCEICCGDYADGITASGKPAEGFLVAAPPYIPFGTLLSIPGYNQGRPVPVLDRGGAIKINKLDVLFSSHQEALNWGRQILEVTIVRMGDTNGI